MTEWTLEYQPLVKPGPLGQRAFHQARYEKRYRGMYAGTGGGKTYAAVAEDLVVALTHPGSVGIVAAPTYPMVRQVLYPTFDDHLGVDEYNWETHPVINRWNRMEHRLEFVNGSVIQFLALERPESSEGKTVNFVHVTEARLVRDWESAWLALKRRLRAKGYQGAWIDTHSPTKELVDEFEADDPRYGVYRWSTKDAYDAGVISQGFYEDMVRSHHGARAQAVLHGLYARPEGLVYDLFDPSRHVKKRPDKTLKDRHSPYTPWTRAMSYGVDWGYTHAAYLAAVAWNGSKAHLVEDYWARYRTTPELVEEAKRLVHRWGHGRFWCGHDEPQSVEQFRAAGLDARILPPEKRKVKDGTRLINGMWKADEFHVDPSCVHFLEEIDMYSLKPGSDEPEDDAPDSMDGSRYAVVGHARSLGGSGAKVVRKAVQRAPRRVEPGSWYGVR